MTVKTQNTYWVSVPPRSSGAELHGAIDDLIQHEAEVRLVAASMNFATPAEICGLRALLDHASAHADIITFECPANPDVHSYLARMDFYSGLPENVRLSRPPPKIRRSDRHSNLIELVRIRNPADVERLMARVHQVAKAQLGAGLAAVACATALGETTANVLEHAGSPDGALVAAQRYQKSTGLELAVVDLGLGIPTTLAHNPAHRGLSDLDAVERSLENGVSRIDEPGRGAGLAAVVRDIGRAGTASLRVGSGGGAAHRQLEERLPTAKQEQSAVPGSRNLDCAHAREVESQGESNGNH